VIKLKAYRLIWVMAGRLSRWAGRKIVEINLKQDKNT